MSILNTAFKHPTIAVDTHIFRVSKRIGLAEGRTPFEVEKNLEQVVPKEYVHNAHHRLIIAWPLYLCCPEILKCPECIIQDLCEFAYTASFGQRNVVRGHVPDPFNLTTY